MTKLHLIVSHFLEPDSGFFDFGKMNFESIKASRLLKRILSTPLLYRSLAKRGGMQKAVAG